MRTSRTVRLGAAAAALGLLLGACSSDDDTTETDTTEEASGSASGTESAAELDLVSDDQLTVCSDIPYPPFEMEAEGGDGYTGFDIDLLEAIAADNGLTLEVKVTPFDGILAALPAGECDLVGSALSITPEREEQVLFSDPYFESEQSLLVLAEDEATYPDLESLAGKTIGVQSGTTGADYAEANKPEGATIKEYEGGTELFTALTSGDIDGALQDFPVNAYQASQDDNFVVVANFGEGEPYGFAVEKGNTALIDAVNASLTSLKDDGTYDEIYESYFGTAPE
jgi:polar amino acid transport system substrate-binding protein